MAWGLESSPLLIRHVLDAESYCTICNNYPRVGRTVLMPNTSHLVLYQLCLIDEDTGDPEN